MATRDLIGTSARNGKRGKLVLEERREVELSIKIVAVLVCESWGTWGRSI